MHVPGFNSDSAGPWNQHFINPQGSRAETRPSICTAERSPLVLESVRVPQVFKGKTPGSVMHLNMFNGGRCTDYGGTLLTVWGPVCGTP